MTMRKCQTMIESLKHQISALESGLARQEDERLCKQSINDSTVRSPKPQKEPHPSIQQSFKVALPIHQPRTRRTKTFPVKLMEAMANCDEDIVAWLPDGRSFVVVDSDMFVNMVLKQTFKGWKYASFMRKLSRWGFIRLRLTPAVNCFYRPLFQRGRIDLCAKMLYAPRNESPIHSMSNRPSLAGVDKFFNVVIHGRLSG